MLTAAIVAAVASPVFSLANFWSIVGVSIAFFGLLIGGIRWVYKSGQKSVEDTSQSVYASLIDDLHEELQLLHKQIMEERQQSARERRVFRLEIERKDVEIVALREELAKPSLLVERLRTIRARRGVTTSGDEDYPTDSIA
jgi:cbb3-type cytochrome oxidase subunit 3